VLLIVVGVQILATGLIAELIVHLARTELPYVLKREAVHEVAVLGPGLPHGEARVPVMHT